jgi:hypothetical protein
MALIKSKKRQQANNGKAWDDFVNGIYSGAPIAFPADDESDREQFLDGLTPASRHLLTFVEQWFTAGRPSEEGRLNSSEILYALKNEEQVRDEFLDSLDALVRLRHSVKENELKKTAPIDGVEIIAKYVLHTRASEIRGAFRGIELAWDIVKFASQLRARRNRTRSAIAKYFHREFKQRGSKARLRNVDICRHLDGIQLRVWQRRAWSPKVGVLVPAEKERLRYPMPVGWLAVIKTDEDDTGPWGGALRHAKLRNLVEKFLSIERQFATSTTANLYWAWLEANGEMETIEGAATEAAATRDPEQPHGAYLKGVIRRTVNVPEND